MDNLDRGHEYRPNASGDVAAGAVMTLLGQGQWEAQRLIGPIVSQKVQELLKQRRREECNGKDKEVKQSVTEDKRE